MKKSNNGLLRVLFAIIISTMVFGFFIQTAEAKPVEQQLLMDKARITFENFMTDKDHSWLREHLNQAKPSALFSWMMLIRHGASKTT